MVNTPLEAAILIVYYVPVLVWVTICLVMICLLGFSPRNYAQKILQKRGYTRDDASTEMRKEMEEILKNFPLDHEDALEREKNLQIYRILINEDKISKKANVFRGVGYVLKEKDKMMISQINSQYRTNTKISEE